MRILNRSLDRSGRVAVGQNQNRVLLWLVDPGDPGQPASLFSVADAILIHRPGVLPLLVIEQSLTRRHYGSFP
jgi:hypothetical protein